MRGQSRPGLDLSYFPGPWQEWRQMRHQERRPEAPDPVQARRAPMAAPLIRLCENLPRSIHLEAAPPGQELRIVHTRQKLVLEGTDSMQLPLTDHGHVEYGGTPNGLVPA